jgi:hypothetical protein
VAKRTFPLNDYSSGLYSRVGVWRVNLQLWPMTDRSLRPPTERRDLVLCTLVVELSSGRWGGL